MEGRERGRREERGEGGEVGEGERKGLRVMWII